MKQCKTKMVFPQSCQIAYRDMPNQNQDQNHESEDHSSQTPCGCCAAIIIRNEANHGNYTPSK